MFSENNELSIPQMKRMFFIEVFATFSLTMPALLTRGMEYCGLYPFLMGSFLAGVYLLFLFVVKQKINVPYGDYIKTQFGSAAQWVIIFLYFFRFLIKSGYTIALFITLIQTNLLKNQAKWVIAIPILFLCGYVAYAGRETRGKVLEILAFFIVVPLFIVILLCIPELNFEQLLPHGHFLKDSFWATSFLVFLCYNPMEFILFYGGGRTETKEKKRKSEWAIGGSFLFVVFSYLCLFLTTIGLFGVQMTKNSLFPAFAIMETAKLPADFISRLDILFIAFWIFGLFGVVSGYCTYAMWIVEKSIRDRKKAGILILFLALALGISLLISNMNLGTTIYFRYLMFLDFPIAIAIPIIILLKKKRRK